MEQSTNEPDKDKHIRYGQSTVVILSNTTVRSIDDISKFKTTVPIERIIELIKQEEKRCISNLYKKVEIAYT